MSKTVVIIQARTGSIRFPNKVFADIVGHPMLWHVGRRASQIEGIDSLVVATSFEEADLAIVRWCHVNGITVRRGGNGADDVLGRYYDVATEEQADVIVRVTADCPLLMPEIGTGVLRALLAENAEYASNVENDRYIDGFDVEAMTYPLLARAHRVVRSWSDREHVTPWMRKHAKVKADYRPELALPKVKLSVDTQEDLDRVRSIFERVGKVDFGMQQVLSALSEHEENGGYFATGGGAVALAELERNLRACHPTVPQPDGRLWCLPRRTENE